MRFPLAGDSVAEGDGLARTYSRRGSYRIHTSPIRSAKGEGRSDCGSVRFDEGYRYSVVYAVWTMNRTRPKRREVDRGRVLFVVTVMRDENVCRIISARKATPYEQEQYFKGRSLFS